MNLGNRMSIALAVFVFATQSVYAQDFDVTFTFVDGTPQQQADFQPLLDQSAAFWESVLVGYQPGVTLTGIDIDVNLTLLAGPGGVLGGHGLTGGQNTTQAGFVFYTNKAETRSVGTLFLNPQSLGNNLLQTAVDHEIGHIIGFGQLFVANNLYIDNSGEYTGMQGLAAYQSEFDAAAKFVPIELDMNAGPNFHLDETNSIVDGMNRPLGSDLMTGFLEANPQDVFFSDTSAAIYTDLGYATATDILLGDLNCDGQINLLDVQPFVMQLSVAIFSAKADINGDGFFNLLDVQPFVDLLAGSAPLPITSPDQVFQRTRRSFRGSGQPSTFDSKKLRCGCAHH